MKKIVLVLSLVFAQLLAFSQAPTVTITPRTITNTSFDVMFTPNETCAYYYIFASTEEDIDMWSSMLACTVEQLIEMWGIQKTGEQTNTWTEMEAATQYKVFALPFAADSTAGTYQFIDITTEAGGGTGTAAIEVTVSNITDTVAMVTCTPNEHTSLFYDGLVTVEFFNQVGADSACTVLRENQMSPYYTTDAWLWQGLIPNTDYYAIAFGRNGVGEWGDTTYCAFATLEATNIVNANWQPIVVYPMPNNGTFNLVGQELIGGTAYLYSLNGQLLQTMALTDTHTQIATKLPAGSYLLQVTNAANQRIGSRVIVIH